MAISTGTEYGLSLPLVNNLILGQKNTFLIVLKELLRDAIKAVGKNVTIEIRRLGPFNYGKDYSLAWYTNDVIKQKKPEWFKTPLLDKEEGCYIYGIIKT